MKYQGPTSGSSSCAQFSDRLSSWIFEGGRAIYIRLHYLFMCAGVPHGRYNLEKVFLHSIHPLKSFKVTSFARIYTIYSASVQALELESFESDWDVLTLCLGDTDSLRSSS